MDAKDQAAIDHVASVSKNPHAAMIVKQLITGWDLKSNITGTIIRNTTWIDSQEWQLIEPKPAYRVYIEPGNVHPAIVRRSTYVTEHKSYDGKVEWISDWIEYDLPKKWPTPLVERIAAIDIKAAEWIVEHWDELLGERFCDCGRYSRNADELRKMFFWSESPQGSAYWSNISVKLGEYN